ncbi:membrane protein [Pontibacillus halophilus JSM 076056 = DSM 19796]|uniref:Membrane protein n=2 Tax=Pontibacillus TaxID=289201 RepID=A0A0A5GL87_9BACI|nr:AI-2E family transporter [Pontibacillus halophilus]KGX91930.1 membrane protein [Pontibacillus halophilus JSM 076056 = DSM 19796]
MNRWDESSPIRFLGGKVLLYILGVILFIGVNILVYTRISYLFTPLVVFIETVALPVILAVVAYYLLIPLISLLEKFGMRRIYSILLILSLVAGLITLLIFLLLPFLEKQFLSLAEELPQYVIQLVENVDAWFKNSIFSNYYNNMFQDVEGILSQLPNTMSTYASNTLDGITTFITTITDVIIAIVTLPFILFYLLKEGYKLPEMILRVFPPKVRPDLRHVFKGIDHQLSAYIQGQILVSVCIGIMMYIGFVIIGLDYALLLAAIASVTSVVPYLGPMIAITPALIIAIVTSPFMLVKLVIVWTIVQLLEGKFISPQIMGKSLHIHPVTIIFVLLTAGHLFGLLGIIVAIPGYAILKVVVGHLFVLFKRRYNRYALEDNQYEQSE